MAQLMEFSSSARSYSTRKLIHWVLLCVYFQILHRRLAYHGHGYHFTHITHWNGDHKANFSFHTQFILSLWEMLLLKIISIQVRPSRWCELVDWKIQKWHRFRIISKRKLNFPWSQQSEKRPSAKLDW